MLVTGFIVRDPPPVHGVSHADAVDFVLAPAAALCCTVLQAQINEGPVACLRVRYGSSEIAVEIGGIRVEASNLGRIALSKVIANAGSP